jgi:pimeloyl-ACP methyl ester carboxylesterase
MLGIPVAGAGSAIVTFAISAKSHGGIMQSIDAGLADGIAFDDTGSGAFGMDPRPVLVLLHGLSWDRRIWQTLLPRLAPRFRCVCIDLPGHGASADLPQTSDYTFEAVAARLHGVLEGLGIERPLMVGHSMGAAIASFYGALYPVRGVVSLDQSFDLAPMVAGLTPWRPMIEGPDFPLFWAELLESFHLAALPGDLGAWAQSLSQPRQEIILRYWHWLFHVPVARTQAHIDAHLGAIAAPFVALHGKLPEAGYASWLKARIGHAEVVELGAPCHMPQLLAPDLLLETVNRLAA